MILWRQIQRQNFNCWKKLAEFLELGDDSKILKKSRFPLNLPVRLAQKIEKKNFDDPILRQFLPLEEERKSLPGYLKDPVGDCKVQKTSKLLQKYHGRALLICTSSCAMHCRFCFRQNYDYETDQGFETEIKMIAEDRSLTEIILSGGDPLSLSDLVLEELLSQLEKIPHVKRIRIHTRFPMGIPERIDPSFLSLLQNRRVQVVFVVHINHPAELDEDILRGLKKIQCLGIPVLNQGVLLRGINDTVSVLKELCETLVNHGILPYYLHQLDRVEGAAHFEVEEERGRELIAGLTEVLSGYAVPKYVREEAGCSSKTALHFV